MTRLISMIAVATLLAGTAHLGAQSGYDLFQKALAAERADGNLTEAISLYERIVNEFRSDRALVARALVRIGESRERLGQREAAAAYQRVVRDFTDQPDSVSVARARLAVLDPSSSRSPAASPFATRQLWTERYIPIWSPSPDGRHVAFGRLNNVFLREIGTGNIRQVTRGGVGPTVNHGGEYPTEVRFSRDGRRIAYGWKHSSGTQLRIIDLDGRNERTLADNPEHEWLAPVAWADGGRILVKINARGGNGQIAWMSLAGGAVQTLKTAPWTALGRVALSPDGRQIAYDQRAEDRPTGRTIYVMAADGTRQVAVTDGTSRDEVVGWLPDGSALAFTTLRSGTPELWLLPIQDGAPAGAATMVRRDLGAIQPLGFTRSGSLFYTQIVTRGDAYIARIDWHAARVVDPRKINSNLTVDFGASWSPDGAQVAYVGHRGTDLTRRVVAVYSLSDGTTREVVPGEDLIIATTGGHEWSPDGTEYLVNGTSTAHRMATFAVNLRTGSLRTLLALPSAYAQIPQWLDNGRSLLYRVRDQFKPNGRVVVRDLDTGHERDVTHGLEAQPGVGVLASPDGQTIALVGGGPDLAPDTLYLMSLDGGQPRQLLQVPGADVWPVAWTPDSRQVIHTRTVVPRNPDGSPRNPGQAVERILWVAPVTGGESRQLQFPHSGASGVDVHPDGQRIAYNVTQNEIEVWTMDVQTKR